MPVRPNSLVARHLLDRRGFLAHMATGMGGIALGALLAEDGLLAADGPRASRGQASAPAGPLAPRPPHFPAKAKRVLHIFCTGAVSHLDTWDYKPELIKRHGQPMPGRREADHVPGRERQPGPEPLGVPAARRDAASNLRPAAAPGRVRRRDVLHPLADLEDEHARAGRDVHEHRVHARGVPEHRRLGQLRAGDREPGPAGVRGDPRPARRPAARARPTGPTASCRPSTRGPPSTPTSRSATWPARRRSRPATTGPRATSSACSTTST